MSFRSSTAKVYGNDPSAGAGNVDGVFLTGAETFQTQIGIDADVSTADNSVAVGAESYVDGDNGIAIGKGAEAQGGELAIGSVSAPLNTATSGVIPNGTGPLAPANYQAMVEVVINGTQYLLGLHQRIPG